jgi:hypothetical protein
LRQRTVVFEDSGVFVSPTNEHFEFLLRDWGAVLKFLKENCRRVKRGQALARLELDLETLGTLVVELPAVNTVRTSLLLLWRYLSFE